MKVMLFILCVCNTTGYRKPNLKKKTAEFPQFNIGAKKKVLSFNIFFIDASMVVFIIIIFLHKHHRFTFIFRHHQFTLNIYAEFIEQPFHIHSLINLNRGLKVLNFL